MVCSAIALDFCDVLLRLLLFASRRHAKSHEEHGHARGECHGNGGQPAGNYPCSITQDCCQCGSHNMLSRDAQDGRRWRRIRGACALCDFEELGDHRSRTDGRDGNARAAQFGAEGFGEAGDIVLDGPAALHRYHDLGRLRVRIRRGQSHYRHRFVRRWPDGIHYDNTNSRTTR
jgi:hypothetical protein